MLQQDVDEVSSARAPLLKKRKCKEGQLPPGPTTCEEALNWVPPCLHQMHDMGLGLYNVDYRDRLQKALASGLLLRTDFSGLGGPEEALDQILTGLGMSRELVTCQRAGDILEHCRAALCHRTGVSAPRCVHADIVDRCPPGLSQELESMRTRYLQAATEQYQKSKSKGEDMFHVLGRKFVRRALQKLSNRAQRTGWASHHTALCCKHFDSCPIFPALPDGFNGLLCSAAGINCYDFSGMGLQKKFLGDSGLVFVVWAWERLMSKEDFFIVECVTNFDDAFLSDLLRESYDLVCLKVCPTLLGLPVSRERKYMVCLGKTMCWDTEVLVQGHQTAFESFFARQIMIPGDDLLRASDDAVANFIRSLAAKRNLPSRRSSNSEWSCYLAMGKSLQTSVQEHEQSLTSQGYAVQSAVLTNLSQRATYMGPVVSGHVPALLRKSMLWSFRRRRLMLPDECLEIQGYNMFGPGVRTCLAEYLQQHVSGSAKREMAGNAMHVAVVGCVLCYVLACARKV